MTAASERITKNGWIYIFTSDLVAMCTCRRLIKNCFSHNRTYVDIYTPKLQLKIAHEQQKKNYSVSRLAAFIRFCFRQWTHKTLDLRLQVNFGYENKLWCNFTLILFVPPPYISLWFTQKYAGQQQFLANVHAFFPIYKVYSLFSLCDLYYRVHVRYRYNLAISGYLIVSKRERTLYFHHKRCNFS